MSLQICVVYEESRPGDHYFDDELTAISQMTTGNYPEGFINFTSHSVPVNNSHYSFDALVMGCRGHLSVLTMMVGIALLSILSSFIGLFIC